MNLILYKSSDLKPLSPLEVLGEFANNRFGKKFLVAVDNDKIKKLVQTSSTCASTCFLSCIPEISS